MNVYYLVNMIQKTNKMDIVFILLLKIQIQLLFYSRLRENPLRLDAGSNFIEKNTNF